MPDIVGIIGKGPRRQNERDLRRMIDWTKQESFYPKGFFNSAETL